jgi:tetraacyldisaccharide 4'-kinase
MMSKLKQIVTKAWNADSRSDFSNPVHSLLYTCSLIYGGIVRLRNLFYDRGAFAAKRLPCPVVSIGNITAGGTGKTPMVIMIAKLLKNSGYHPAVLSRGYAGKNEKQVNVVSDGSRIFGNPDDTGDEPFLIAASAGVPMLTGADRFAAGSQAVAQMGADVLVLDDAFQHRGLHRDLNILLLDAERPFGNGCLLPRGSLREPRGALKRADMIVLTRSGDGGEKSPLEEELENEFPDIPVFRAGRRPKAVIPLSSPPFISAPSTAVKPTSTAAPSPDATVVLSQSKDDSRGSSSTLNQEKTVETLRQDQSDNEGVSPPDFIRGKRVCAFAGIANPDSFRKTVESLGAEVVVFYSFPDHHHYTRAEIEAVRQSAQELRAEITLTTEKDGVKLPGLDLPLADIYALKIEMTVTKEKEFNGTVLARLK